MGYAMALLCACSFSLYYVFLQKGMKLTKDNGVLITLVINCLVLTVVFVISQILRPTFLLLNYKTLFYFVLAGLFTTLWGRMSITTSLRYIGSNRGVAIKNAAPLFTVLTASLFLGETLSMISWLACLIIFLGIYYIIFYQMRSNKETDLRATEKAKYGYLFAILAAFFFGTGDTVRKLGMEEISDPILGVFLGVLISTICMLILTFKNGGLNTFKAMKSSLNKYYLMAGLLSSLAMLSFFISIQYIQVIYASILVGLEPVITVILVSILLKNEDTFNKHLLISISLVFLGTILLVLSP